MELVIRRVGLGARHVGRAEYVAVGVVGVGRAELLLVQREVSEARRVHVALIAHVEAHLAVRCRRYAHARGVLPIRPFLVYCPVMQTASCHSSFYNRRHPFHYLFDSAVRFSS